MSCLFNSMNYFFNEGSHQIRNKICDYLEQNKTIIDGVDTQFILRLERHDYIQHMRKMSTWGGAIEIQAACNIWNTNIYVKNIRNREHNTIEFLPLSGSAAQQIRISWNGGHYEPIREIS